MTVFVLKRQKKRNYTSCYPMLLKNQRHSFRPVGESPLLQFITLKSLDLKVRKIVHIVYRSLFLLSSEATIIPGTVTARLSLRIVPDQDLDTIVRSLRDYIQTSFNVLQSTNGLKVNPFYNKKQPEFIFSNKINIDHTADWWLGNLDDHWFKWLESAVQEEWSIEPLRIREGGVSF